MDDLTATRVNDCDVSVDGELFCTGQYATKAAAIASLERDVAQTQAVIRLLQTEGAQR